MSSDIERLRRDILLSDVAAQFGLKLEKDGREYIACCPFHAEDTASFTVFTGKDSAQRFHCFGCGAQGDVLDFVQALKGVDLREAIKILGGGKAGPNVQRKQIVPRDIYAGITPLDPVSEVVGGRQIALYNPKRADTEREWGRFTPSMVFPYRRADGSLTGYVLRRDLSDGKETPMVMWVRLPNGKECWARFPFSKPRQLYGLDKLGDARQVIVVEGEKCRDKLAAATGRCVVSWPGGTQGVKHCDWSPLAGRNVVIWPDADKPGLATANEIAKNLVGLGCTVRVMDVMRDSPKEGWDCADAIDDGGWSKADLDTFMRDTVQPWSPPQPPEPAPPAPAKPASAPATKASGPVVEARTTEQEKPASATVTHLHTRQTVQADDSWMLDLVFNAEGKLKPGVTKNWALFLEHHPDMSGVFAWDAFKLRVVLQRRPPWERGDGWQDRVLQDRDYSEAVMWLEGRQMTPKASNIAAVIQTVAEHNSFDRLREYLDGLEWDRKPRIATWLSYYLGVDDSEYARSVGTRWLISSVARGLKPGCKVDTMPILEGPQGAKKSTALRVLYGDEFFTDELSDIGGKDALMEMQGVWGLEVAEMHRFSAAETNAVKKFLSRQVDRYRPPYGRSVIEAPRRCVLNGTINPEGSAYLRDPTGARRFWPITIGAIDIEGLQADRDQLWAEAVALYKEGAPWWVQAEEQAAVEVEQEKRTDVDVWVDLIVPVLNDVPIKNGMRSIAQVEIFAALGIPKKDADWRHSGRIGRVMKKLKWTVTRDRRDGEDRVVFQRTEHDVVGDQQTLGGW